MDIKMISSENREKINDFISSHWYSTDMVVRGELVDMTILDGFVIYEGEAIIGLVTYKIKGAECEIMSLDSFMENQGIGTALVNKVIEIARRKKCMKIRLITTNDNINAIRFYQKRGFDMAKLYHNALDISRKLKPSIPLLGEFGIPLKHEIEFEMDLFHKITKGHDFMKKKVAFVCVHNSCRSQMAEGWAKKLGSDVIEAYSAGTENYSEVKPLAVEVMKEADVDMSCNHPKLLSDIPEKVDILITMGCNVMCPFVPCSHREDWGIEDPSGGPIEGYRISRDSIKEKVEELIHRIKENQI